MLYGNPLNDTFENLLKFFGQYNLTLVFGGFRLFVFVAFFSDVPALVACRVTIGLQHISPGHLTIGATLAPRRLIIAASYT